LEETDVQYTNLWFYLHARIKNTGLWLYEIGNTKHLSNYTAVLGTTANTQAALAQRLFRQRRLLRFIKRPVNPCLPECAERSVTCKFDGTCEKYKAFEAKNKAYRKFMADSRASVEVDRNRADRVLYQLGRRHTR
jgi:hypothetical protein